MTTKKATKKTRARTLLVRLEDDGLQQNTFCLHVGDTYERVCKEGLRGFLRKFGPKKTTLHLSRAQVEAFLMHSATARSTSYCLVRGAFPGENCSSFPVHMWADEGWVACLNCGAPTGWGKGKFSKRTFVKWLVDGLFELQEPRLEGGS